MALSLSASFSRDARVEFVEREFRVLRERERVKPETGRRTCALSLRLREKAPIFAARARVGEREREREIKEREREIKERETESRADLQ